MLQLGLEVMQAPFQQETTKKGKLPCLSSVQLKDAVSHSRIP